MYEQKNNDQWNEIAGKLRLYKNKIKFAAQDVVDGVVYDFSITAQERQDSQMAEVFAGEAMSFLKDNHVEKLSPLHLTIPQHKIFQFLMDCIDTGSLTLKTTKGKVRANNVPYVIKHYQAGDDLNGSASSTVHPAELLERKDVHLTVRWGLREPYPHGFSIYGSSGIEMPRRIDFITLPTKADSLDEVKKIFGIPDPQGEFIHRVGVYNKGQRIIINRTGVYQDSDFESTVQYHLIGSFFGEETRKEYWVYGSNEEKDESLSFTKRVGVAGIVTQSV